MYEENVQKTKKVKCKLCKKEFVNMGALATHLKYVHGINTKQDPVENYVEKENEEKSLLIIELDEKDLRKKDYDDLELRLRRMEHKLDMILMMLQRQNKIAWKRQIEMRSRRWHG